MDRAGLERLLDEGLSLEEIGRRVGRAASTVGYWLRAGAPVAVQPVAPVEFVTRLPMTRMAGLSAVEFGRYADATRSPVM